MRGASVCPVCGGEGASSLSGWGLICKRCFLEWHWTHDDGVYAFVLPENKYKEPPRWSVVPHGCLPIIREEHERDLEHQN
jgi:hypothetical protein